jgi:hypothetical protein
VAPTSGYLTNATQCHRAGRPFAVPFHTMHLSRNYDCSIQYISLKVPNYLEISPRFASSCTDFVVANLSIVDLLDGPQALGGFVICSTNTR